MDDEHEWAPIAHAAAYARFHLLEDPKAACGILEGTIASSRDASLLVANLAELLRFAGKPDVAVTDSPIYRRPQEDVVDWLGRFLLIVADLRSRPEEAPDVAGA